MTGLILFDFVLVFGVGGLYAVTAHPSLGAEGADVLRSAIGDEAVSSLEMLLFQIQDDVLSIRYSLGLSTPAAPWQLTSLPPPVVVVQAATDTPGGSSTAPTATPLTPIPFVTATPGPQVEKTPWRPAAAKPLGTLAGEGIWYPYIEDTAGHVVAYRTFLQPDQTRPYAIVGVVAFDATLTRLHFVLGSIEPFSSSGPKRTGAMPVADKTPGVLLAMFNGGFKARNGNYGAMADGIVALPPRDGLGTVAIYKDGSLQIGEWGTGISPSPDLVAWRQNGPLVIQQGEINARIYNNLPQDWGYTVTDVSPTWRSGLGLSADGKTYYYLCGSSMSMDMLARTMIAAGIDNGIQLDINAYWVNFIAVRTSGPNLVPEALFPAMMKENIDRYLYPYTRDFFYVTISGKS